MTKIDVVASPVGDGWSCVVTVSDASGETRHTVSVRRADLARLAPAHATPERLVRRSFEFLLERESKESILRSFALVVIGRYFPEFERVVKQRLTAPVEGPAGR
jgi:hypothetical protein